MANEIKQIPANHLIIFEEKIEFKDLTDRERQAYERGKEDGINDTENKIILTLLVAVIGVGITLLIIQNFKIHLFY